MIIDFHTHIFPDQIAEKTIRYLEVKGEMPAHTDGTLNGLFLSMKNAGIDVSVVMPVVTAPKQFESINKFAVLVNEIGNRDNLRIISFGGIHPDCDDIAKKMEYIASLGLKGVKIHPDYQGHYINDEKYLKIFDSARSLGLTVLTHAGVDAGFRDSPVRCTPLGAREVIAKFPDLKLVLAHCGANEMIDEAYESLYGENVYIDTSLMLPYISKEKIRALIDKHGNEKILFASDSPWCDVGLCKNILNSCDISSSALENIYHKNAERLLCI
jgi:predicted TIM-barrel fold metal-dependent hydrolase